MTATTATWIASLVMALICLFIALYRVHQIYKEGRVTSLPIGKIITDIVLVLIAVSAAMINPTVAWLNILGFCSYMYGLYLFYDILRQTIHNTRIHPARDTLFIVTTIIAAVLVLFGCFSSDNLNSFLNSDEFFRPTLFYYLYNYFGFGFLTYLALIIAISYGRTIHTPRPARCYQA